MPEIQTADGPIKTDLPAEAVKDLEVTPPAPAPEPAKPEEGKQPEAKPAEEPAKEPAKTPEPEPKGETPIKPKKAGPIADLLAKNHEATARAEAAEKRAQELEAQLQKLSEKPASPEATEDIKALAEKYSLEPEVLSDIVALARKGFSPSVQLPKEVTDMLAEHQQTKAIAAEQAAFNKRVDSLAAAIPGEPIKEHKDRLMELAYSDKTDPVTGERYADMELAEIYFRVIKPEVEAGKPSGEMAPTSGTKAAKPVLDYEEILNDDEKMQEFAQKATSEEWAKFTKWRDARQGDVPIRNNKS